MRSKDEKFALQRCKRYYVPSSGLVSLLLVRFIHAELVDFSKFT
jgi:hypothetical protein